MAMTLGGQHTLKSAATLIKAFVEDQVTEHGYGTISEYVRGLIRRDQDRKRLRDMLLEGAESPQYGPANDAYFDALRARVRQRAE